ncbi:rhomboid family intramembrane serine protease [Myxococcota bacterium]|jgi:membrane associated rhomboid family serine protease|nr:rhomboid family intramembrane serine protease [Myxococcota bacterium]
MKPLPERPRLQRLDDPPGGLLDGAPELREKVRDLAVVSRLAAPSFVALALAGSLALHYGLFLVLAPRSSGGGLHPVALLLAGAKSNPLIEAGEWWRMLAAIWLHASWPHLLVNLAGLLLLGQIGANALGAGRMLLVFFVGGAASFLASFLAGTGDSVGSSGAVHALLGSLLVFGVIHRRRIPRSSRPWWMATALFFTAMTVLTQALDPHSDRMAHLGGLLAGALLGAPLSRAPRLFEGGPERRSWPLGLLVVAVVSLALAAGVTGLAGLQSQPVLPDPGLREARPAGLRIRLPSRWEAGRLREGRCMTPLPPGTSWTPAQGETLCLRDPYGALLLLGPPASVTPGVAVDPSLTGIGGLRTLLREPGEDTEKRWMVLNPQWALSIRFFRILAPAYDPLLEEIASGMRLAP